MTNNNQLNRIFAQRGRKSSSEETTTKIRKIAFLVSEDWFFASHFLPFLREARSLGIKPIVITRTQNSVDTIEGEGGSVIHLNANRSSFNPLAVLRNIYSLFRILHEEQPDIVHCISLRVVVLGGIAARLAGSNSIILAPVGLGHIWLSKKPLERLVRSAIRVLVGKVLRRRGTTYLFENTHDPLEFGLHPTDHDVAIVGGAGVNPEQFSATDEPKHPPIKIAVVARMLRSKGILETIESFQKAISQGLQVELSLFGEIDELNPSSLTHETLSALCKDTGAKWYGHVKDIDRIWREHHIAMLLSHREGLPRSLIEASACGRPIITTDVPGCNTVVRHNIEGLLVPLGDTEEAANALIRLASDEKLRKELGQNARLRFHTYFTETAVRQVVRNLYLEPQIPK